ncbi:MAG: DUF4783 domain-containing protein [Bacteroidales bacterium]|nr:DUF4783 domain-containing protein [Bacteroidales bacterium]
MKQLATSIFAALCILIFSGVTSNAKAQESEITNEIVKCLSSANASKLATYFNTSLDLTLPGHEGAYSAKQAEQIVKKFFSENPVSQFSLEHTGNSNNGSRYLIGSYKTTSLKNYRVYILIKKRNEDQNIQQLQFEVD